LNFGLRPQQERKKKGKRGKKKKRVFMRNEIRFLARKEEKEKDGVGTIGGNKTKERTSQNLARVPSLLNKKKETLTSKPRKAYSRIEHFEKPPTELVEQNGQARLEKPLFGTRSESKKRGGGRDH